MSRTVVVGGGVIGCTLAYRLATAGHQVTLLERDRVGAHASGAAAGLLAPFSEAWGSEILAGLAAESLSLFPELVEGVRSETGIDPEYRDTQSLRLALSVEEERGLERLAAGLKERGRTVELLDTAGARQAEPELTTDVRLAARLAESQVTPIRLVEGLARAAARRGVEVRQSTPAQRLLARGGRLEAVQCPGERLGADWVIVAAGPWTPEIVATVDLEVDVEPRRGQLVALAPDRALISHILTRDRYYLVPKPDGTIVAGSTEEEQGFDARATVDGVRRLLTWTESVVPNLGDATVARVWAGIRPSTSSGVPYIGLAGEYENLVLATGHHRNGILLAPITAEIVLRGMAGSWRDLG